VKTIEISDGRTLWQNGFEGGLDESPLFGANQICVRSGRFSGYVYSINRSTGAVLWRTNQKVVSNIAVAGETVFALTGEGELLCYEGESGESHLLAGFDPSPNDLAKSRPTVEGGYYIAADLKYRRVCASQASVLNRCRCVSSIAIEPTPGITQFFPVYNASHAQAPWLDRSAGGAAALPVRRRYL
jgi:PQQ-like domain